MRYIRCIHRSQRQKLLAHLVIRDIKHTRIIYRLYRTPCIAWSAKKSLLNDVKLTLDGSNPKGHSVTIISESTYKSNYSELTLV